jgi:hypothetical protein
MENKIGQKLVLKRDNKSYLIIGQDESMFIIWVSNPHGWELIHLNDPEHYGVMPGFILNNIKCFWIATPEILKFEI